MTSEKQVEANKKNAQKSTGPKDASKTRFNALKHGLLAKALIITEGESKENKEEFNFILLSLREELKPEGIIQEMLVERMAVCYWRLQRVVRAERGELRQVRDTITSDASRLDPLSELLESFKGERLVEIENRQTPQERFASQVSLLKDIRSIPPYSNSEILLRYETSIERQFYRALREFMKIKKNGFVS